MQAKDGRLVELEPDEIQKMKTIFGQNIKNRLVHIGQCFKISHTYWKIETMSHTGFCARGITKKEYETYRKNLL